MKFVKMIVLAAATAVLHSCGTANSKAVEDLTPAENLRERLVAVQDSGKTLFGHHDDPVYGHDWKWEKGRSDVLEVCGAYPAVMSWDLGRIELGDSLNIDGIPFERIRSEAIAQDARGGINTFSWHLWDPVNGNDSWNTSDTTVVHKMVTDSLYVEAYRKQLRKAAEFFKSLTGADGKRIGVVFRPWHENTGGWFWWGESNCLVEDYKSLWRIMREEFDNQGVDNVLWSYSPDRSRSEEHFTERYPGDSLVDIIGTDIYHFGGPDGTEGYINDVNSQLSFAADFASRHNKLVAFTETGCEGLPIEDWWTSVLLPLLKENQVAYVVVWRNAHDKPGHFYAPYPGHPSAKSFKTFVEDPKIVVLPTSI